MSQERARKIKLILFDVDGVMTDGSIWLFPAPPGARQSTRELAGQYADAGGYAVSSDAFVEAKGFNAHDGTATTLARLAGLKTGVITKRISETVALRARDLRLDHVHQGVADKLTAMRDIAREEGIREEEIAYVGDDLIDLPVMKHCGLAIAVPNGSDEVKAIAHWTTPRAGGHGAVRDAVEYVLRAQGKWDAAVEMYLAARGPEKKER
jgi:3-deoxy-D-manno-octulosonate 8-phosphate phosphatase (KDO 8-P phosphatase)